MARPGVTYQDIASAAIELKSQGKSITIENVRAILGTGSIGTINNHLRKWKEAQNPAQIIASKENLPDSLVSLMKGLWEGVVNQSAERFVPIEEKLQLEMTELKQELEKYKNNNRRWQKLFNLWMQEKIQLANEQHTLEQALEFSHKENNILHTKQDGLLQQLRDKQDRIDELHILHKQAQQNLEHYRESVREQRVVDQQQYEQQKQQLLFEIKNLHEQFSMQQDKATELERKNQILTLSNSTLEMNINQSQLMLEKTQAKLLDTEKTVNEQLTLSLHWQNQHNEIHKKLDLINSQFIEIQTENKLLTQQRTELKQSLKDLQNQNKLLNSEKWQIAQEKSQLEGRLRQKQEMAE